MSNYIIQRQTNKLLRIRVNFFSIWELGIDFLLFIISTELKVKSLQKVSFEIYEFFGISLRFIGQVYEIFSSDLPPRFK